MTAIEATWSRSGGSDCIRLTGLPADAHPQVRPGTATGELPPMAGRLVRDGDAWCFIPRFAFLDGMTYTIAVEGAVATLARDHPNDTASTAGGSGGSSPGASTAGGSGGSSPRASTAGGSGGSSPRASTAGGSCGSSPRPGTLVAGIWPTSSEVPRNLLRLYVWFSAPMSEGYAASHVRLANDHGSTIANALLPGEYELWDAARRRLTVLLDPARIKRGLAAHSQLGYPLRTGEPFWLVIDGGFRDARGLPLRAGTKQRYQVGDDERRHVDPSAWVLTVPKAGTVEPALASFDRPLDHGLLARCLHVTGPDGQLVHGTRQIGTGEMSWELVPRQAWASGPHQFIVDPALEDLAGNSVSRVFDRDLTRPQDQPFPARPVTLTFTPR